MKGVAPQEDLLIFWGYLAWVKLQASPDLKAGRGIHLRNY